MKKRLDKIKQKLSNNISHKDICPITQNIKLLIDNEIKVLVKDKNKSKGKNFLTNARSKIENIGFFMEEVAEKPETILKKVWKRYERWIFLVVLYLTAFLVFRWLGKTNPIARVIAILLLVGSPFFILWIITKFIPEIKVGEKIIFSKEKLNLNKQIKYGLRGMTVVLKEIYRAYPTFSLAVIFGLILLLFIAV